MSTPVALTAQESSSVVVFICGFPLSGCSPYAWWDYDLINRGEDSILEKRGGGGARGERFRCLMVKDWSFLVDEGVFSVALPVSRIWSYFKTLDLLVSSLTLCLKSSPASVSSWFVCFPSRSGSSICCFLWGCSSLSHLSACGLCLIFWKCTWSSWGLELASWLLKFCWKR